MSGESAIESKLNQLLKLYGNQPPAPESEFERIKSNIQSGEGLTTIRDYSKYRGQCIATTYNHIARGILNPVKIGGSTFLNNSDLLAMERPS
jgi:hypothetical protein